MAWQLQEAKQRFSEVVRLAIEDGPQTVTRHGREAVVIVKADDFRRLNRKRDFKEFLLTARTWICSTFDVTKACQEILT